MEAYPDEIDLREYLEILWRWRMFVVGITLIAAVTAGAVSFFVIKPTYEASVQIMVPQSPLPAEIIKSPHFMDTIIRETGLRGEYDSFKLAKEVSLETSRASASLTTIKVQNTDPERAVLIANRIALDFLEFVKSKNMESVSGSVSYLVSQKTEAETSLGSLRRALADLKQSTRVEALQQEVGRLSGQLASFRSQQVAGEMRERELLTGIAELAKALEATPPTVSGPPDWSGRPTEIPNETYQRLNQTLTFKKVELTETRTRLTEIAAALPPMKAEYDGCYAKLLDYQRQIQELENKEVVLTEQIKSYTERVNELATSLPQTNIVSPAVTPTRPVKPHKLMNIMVAAVLGGFMSILAVFGIEYWRSPRKGVTLAQ